MEYLALRALVEKRGLLAKEPWYYVRLIAILVTLFVTLLVIYYLVDNLVVQLLMLLGLVILAVQLGFLAHDADHAAISDKKTVNTLIGSIGMTLINGVSLSYWSQNHNAHHKDPNMDPGDPDIEYLLSEAEEQARKRKGVMRWLTRHQAFFFVPVHSLIFFSMYFNSWRHFIRHCRGWRLAREFTFMMLHYCIWIVIPGLLIGFWKAALLYAAASILRGLYFSMVFVPNHVGMPSPKRDMNFLQKQVVSARNLTPSWFNDLVFGGLNYQIEHHLFPATPRKHLRHCRDIVKEFCAKHDIQYVEVGVFTCYRDVFRHMHAVGKAAA